MKKVLTLMMIGGLFTLVACGPSAEEQAEAEAQVNEMMEGLNSAMDEAMENATEEATDAVEEGAEAVAEGAEDAMEGAADAVEEAVEEVKVEMVVADEIVRSVLEGLLKFHPYEEPAYEVYKIYVIRQGDSGSRALPFFYFNPPFFMISI